MPLILSGNVASATADAGYTVANSCRFDRGSSAYMHKTPGGAGSLTTWTISAWVKRANEHGTNSYILDCGAGNGTSLYFGPAAIEFWDYQASAYTGRLTTNAVYRDHSAWYHVVAVWDTTNGTAGDRMKLYVNGTEVTSFATDTNPSSSQASILSSTTQITIGSQGTSIYANLYMAEVCFIDGQALTPSSFGEFNEDSPQIWQPKDVSGLTFGNNGFYLDFEDSGDLGDDESGNTNDWTETNVAATDQATDSPTNNFCTLNPLATFAYNPHSFSEGNTVFHGGADQWQGSIGTFGVTTGKWYYEVKMVTTDSVITDSLIGFMGYDEVDVTSAGSYNGSGAFFYNSDGGEIKVGNTSSHTITTADYGTFSNGDIMGIALDYDNEYLSIYKNGSALATNYDFSGITNSVNGGKIAIPAIVGYGGDNAAHIAANFGNPYFSISSGNADGNGYGNFEYAVPSGYLALCTKNLGSDGG